MRSYILATAAAAAALLAIPGVSAAQTNVTVSTSVTNFCGIGLANVAGGNVAVANGARQKVTTLRMSCNSPTGATLTSSAQNGDFKSAGGVLINYDWDLSVPAIPSLGFAPVDTWPGSPAILTNSGGYSQALADGIFADLFLNLCYNVPGGPGVGGSQGDNSNPGSSGCAASPSGPGAASAPAGTYTEVFTFALNPT
ncbi:hypothetical protein E4M02_03380 [Brevundimonas sp. S30B]|uniref:hypothetical protein n=1 Tax=unclassified Brevundimonas TaxID=2622653 RepID=UPI001072DE2B|nr:MULTISPECIES: hypothetical protein [unclassified Brevundimonas]QBX37077.1 hypothetical protein E4M01_04435 [Brevundimonas sp. MF30-B]TFW04127.1 hypothetical protein E4M02_03380 [Brevundimonas sp. S30B]